jgi:hypothetical protein
MFKNVALRAPAHAIALMPTSYEKNTSGPNQPHNPSSPKD